MRRQIKIIVTTHVKCEMPQDKMYLPLQVGAEGKEDLGYIRDDTGKNISSLNPYFCELTGLYWAWKNLNYDYIGLCHYRRMFSRHKGKTLDLALKSEDIQQYLGKIKVFVPKKRHYYIETLYSHYAHTHYVEQLDITREIIKNKYPNYLHTYDKTMKSTSGFMFNMMILQKELLDDYCTWLFDILFALFDKVDRTKLDTFQARYIGRIGELLFNVWLEKRLDDKEIVPNEIQELPYIEDVNWYFKVKSFLLAKFLHKKYKQSAPRMK